MPAVPLPPSYAELVAALAEVGRSVVAHGLVVGSGGNLSARHLGADEVLVTATGTWLDRLTAEAFSVVGLDGTVRAGHPAATSELPLHLASYRARPDITALIHLHPQTSVLLAALGQPIRLLTTDHVYYVRRVRSVPFLPPGTPQLAAAAAEALADGCNCVILHSHGCSVVADSVQLAHQRVANLEQAALATYRLLLLGDTGASCPVEYAERLARFDRDPATRSRH